MKSSSNGIDHDVDGLETWSDSEEPGLCALAELNSSVTRKDRVGDHEGHGEIPIVLFDPQSLDEPFETLQALISGGIPYGINLDFQIGQPYGAEPLTVAFYLNGRATAVALFQPQDSVCGWQHVATYYLSDDKVAEWTGDGLVGATLEDHIQGCNAQIVVPPPESPLTGTRFVAEARVLCQRLPCLQHGCTVPVSRMPFQVTTSNARDHIFIVLALGSCTEAPRAPDTPGCVCEEEVRRLAPLLRRAARIVFVADPRRPPVQRLLANATRAKKWFNDLKGPCRDSRQNLAVFL